MSKNKKKFVNAYLDEFGIPNDAVAERVYKCPVKVGDRFYRKTACVENGACLKDYLKVTEIIPHDGVYAIRARYENHAIGPFERTFSSDIFKTDDWEIVRA